MAAGLPDTTIARPAINTDGEMGHDIAALSGIPDGTRDIPAADRARQMARTGNNPAAAGTIAAGSAAGTVTLPATAEAGAEPVRSASVIVVSGPCHRRSNHGRLYIQLDLRFWRYNLGLLGAEVFW